MNNKNLKSKLSEIHTLLDEKDEGNTCVNLLTDFAETAVEEIDKLSQENKELKNIISKLTGEQPLPLIRKQTKSTSDKNDHSSEQERKKKKKRGRGKSRIKRSRITVDETIYLFMEPGDLPADARKQGIRPKLSQDVKIISHNILFNRQMYFSPSENKTYITPLPAGYDGDYGPNIKSWTNVLFSEGQMTIDKITWVFKTAGAIITNPTVHGFIMSAEEAISEEKIDIVKCGLASTSYQHLDDTSGREKGQNRFVNTLGNQYYSSFFSLSGKDRLSIIEMLSLDKFRFLLNEEAFSLMARMRIPKKYIIEIRKHASVKFITRNNIDVILADLFTDKLKYKKHRKAILEATAIAAYRQGPYAIKQLIVDDAPQFKLITEGLGLCWIHEGRHYKKMKPIFKKNSKVLESFVEEFWNYYHSLVSFKENPTNAESEELKREFRRLFSQKTGYQKLDNQIALTLNKIDSLLLVLKHPQIPLHNNPAELMARYQARGRDVHLHTMSAQGTRAKDSLATVSGTAKKLSVNLFHYLYDRLTEKFEMMSLAELITMRSASPAPDHDSS